MFAMPRRPRKRANGAGSYQQRGDRHIVQWTTESGRRTESFPSAEAARSAMARGLAAVPAAPAGTLAEHGEKWLVDRQPRRSFYQDSLRWRNHWLPLVGKLAPDELTVAVLKDCLRALRSKGLSNASIRLCIALLSAIYSDLVEDGFARTNVTKTLSKKTRGEYLRSTHDPRKVPFLPEPLDALRVHRQLADRHPSIGLAYAIGVFAGLRTGEARALQWEGIDLQRRTITVTHSVEKRTGRAAAFLSNDGLVVTKSAFSRVVPITDLLLPILRAHEPGAPSSLVCPGNDRGLLLPFLTEEAIGEAIEEALDALELPSMTFYEATRHSFASQWVLHGGNIHTLSTILGHSSIQVTERHYVHLVPGRFTDADRAVAKAA